MLMELTPTVNFINIKRANFSYEFFDKAKIMKTEKDLIKGYVTREVTPHTFMRK